MSKTALFKASRLWDAETARQILQKNPTLTEARDAIGRTALHICCGVALEAGRQAAASIETAKALLDAGFDVNVVQEIPDDGEIFAANPLWHAVGRGRNRELAQFLLTAGAHPDPSLWTVVWSNDLEALKMLLAAGAHTGARFDGETPLIYAARLGREGCLLELIRAGADSTVRDKKGRSVIELAERKKMAAPTLAILRAAAS